ncbi:hypothetical protein C0J45_11470 [Silurus meridionalis]|nr:hypothetical protein C0J45_11470 [Silurus meridionalis]
MSEMGAFKKLDDTTLTILKAANISEGLLHTFSRDDIRDLFPGPEHFLRRRSIWQMIHPEEQASNSGHPQSLSDGSSASPSNEPPQTNLHGATSLKRATPKKVLQLPSPEYVIYTDNELEQVRKHYFEMKNIGREGGCTLSKELRCRLVRNTMTNMVSILRATVEAEDVRYPSKEEITAMAKRLVEYYPMLQDKPGGSKHSWVTLFRQLYKRLQNIRSPQRTQGPTPERGRRRKRRRIDFGTSSEQGDGTSTEEYDADSSASTVILDASPARSSTPERVTAKLQNLSDRIDENRSTDQDSQQAQARHYRTLQEVYKRPKPNKDAVAQLLDLEFEARRAFIDSDTLKDQDRPAKIIEAYPCFKDLNHVLGELCRIVSKDNTAYIKEVKERWDTFQSQAIFYGIMKKVMKPPVTLNTEERAINMLKSLPAMFPSAVAPPKKLGRESEALLHVLMPSEDPNTYLQRRPLSCPVLIVDKENCMVAIGTTPVATFPKNHLHEGALYLMAYYYALHLTYPKCIATLLSVLQTEVLQDEIHERDTTSSYRKAMAEWKKFIGE